MVTRSIGERVETLEKMVMGSDGLIERVNQLHAKVDRLEANAEAFRAEFLQFGHETRSEFSAVRKEVADGFATARREVVDGLNGLRHELGTQMRVLHEEVLARIALLDEHRNGRRRRKNGR